MGQSRDQVLGRYVDPLLEAVAVREGPRARSRAEGVEVEQPAGLVQLGAPAQAAEEPFGGCRDGVVPGARDLAVDDLPALLPHLVEQVLEHFAPDPRAARAGSDGDPDVGDVDVLPLRERDAPGGHHALVHPPGPEGAGRRVVLARVESGDELTEGVCGQSHMVLGKHFEDDVVHLAEALDVGDLLDVHLNVVPGVLCQRRASCSWAASSRTTSAAATFSSR